jgi:hypothetical protein
MKNYFLIFSIIAFFLLNSSCIKDKKNETAVVAKEDKLITVPVKKIWESEEYGLDDYFERNEIKPTAVFYNKHDSSKIAFLNHLVRWINIDGVIKLNIDGDIFRLDKGITLNDVWGEDKDSITYMNDWDEMKYYKYKNYEMIGIRMHFDQCTGIGCSVNYFLWYDLKKRTKNYFGTFRTDNKLALYSFNNNQSIDYVSGTFIGDAQGGTEMHFKKELYSLNDKGVFILQQDSNGNPYQITQTTFPNDTTIPGDKVTINWFEDIKE